MDHFEIFKKYYEKIVKNGKLNEIIKECRNMEPTCSMHETTTVKNPDNYLNVCGPEILSPNDKLMNTSSSVKSRFHKTKGVQLTANEFIPKDTVLIRERPTILQLYPPCECLSLDQTLYRCHNCAFAMLKSISCEHCDMVAYCSRACLVEANNTFHKYECYGFQRHYWPMMNTDHSYMAMRMMLYGVDYLDDMKPPPPDESAVNPSGRYGYPAIYYMSSHLGRLKPKDLDEICYKVTRSLVYLIDKTRFFHKYQDRLYDMYLHVGGLMLHHYCQAEAQVVYVEYPNLAEGYGFEIIGGRGQAICPTISMMNHSCKANCIIIVFSDSIVVKSIRDIKKNEELTIHYMEVNPFLTTEFRQLVTKELHFFECKCERCLSDMYFSDKYYSCLNCGERVKSFWDTDEYLIMCDTCEQIIPTGKHEKLLAMINNLKKENPMSQKSLCLIMRIASRVYHCDSLELATEFYYICNYFFELATREGVHNMSQLSCGLSSFRIRDAFMSGTHKKYVLAKLEFFEKMLHRMIVCEDLNEEIRGKVDKNHKPLRDFVTMEVRYVINEWNKQLQAVAAVVLNYIPPFNTKFQKLLTSTKEVACQILNMHSTPHVLTPITNTENSNKRRLRRK
ncbi:SET and MYND domain-containing protein 4 isoform X2 [Aethina tumida]|uniref:SET and MYND domain-containing protein 4 isoform X2 n=1 Tax=Aethina tumida TaxID=116153 RepID=UPI002147702E|nr:SET and MYND domain-containing protein 4 isoform X2 [Aethina tumida]